MKISADKITSRKNLMLSELIKLDDKKHRDEARSFRFDGKKLFIEAVENRVSIKKIFLCESRFGELMGLIREREAALEGTLILTVSDDIFMKISPENAPEGIICVADYMAKHERSAFGDGIFEQATSGSPVLLLESVRDPGNVGTIIRSAAAFGVKTVCMSRDCADIYNPKTLRAAMGALFGTNILYFDDIKAAIKGLQDSGRSVYAAALDRNAVRLGDVTLSASDCVVIGNEGHGLSECTIAACDKSLFIPMEANSESLNAAIAASVIMWNIYMNR